MGYLFFLCLTALRCPVVAADTAPRCAASDPTDVDVVVILPYKVITLIKMRGKNREDWSRDAMRRIA